MMPDIRNKKSLVKLSDRPSKDVFDSIPDTEEPGILGSFRSGLKGGALGTLLGYQRGKKESPPSFFEGLLESSGELVSDFPAMFAGGIAGAPGGPVASTAAAFAAPTLIKEIANEWRSFEKTGKDLSLESFMQHLGKVGLETGKSSLIGAATGGIGKLMPILSKIPGISKLFAKSPATKAISQGALELGALTGASSALEGELPTKEQLARNALLLGGAKAVGAGIGKGGELISKVSPKLSGLVGTAKTKIESYKKSREQSKEYFNKLKDYVSEKDVKGVESQFKWKRALDSAEIEGKFTPKTREEMIYYRQKTGNPFVEGDSYEALSKRMPDSAKKFVDNVVDKHLKESLRNWNEDLKTRNIAPRDALEDIYLPGMYEYDPEAQAKIDKSLKVKNPFANQKQFLSYNEALTKAGLKPKHKDIIGLMKNFDETMNKVKSNVKLLDEIKTLESDTGQNVIVRSDDYNAYQKAKADGYKPFYDPILRRVKENGKWVESSKPALVKPEFAEAFQGVFQGEPSKPTSFALNALDKARDEIRFFRVKFSPFHYGALTESAVGSLGLKGLRFPTIAKEGNQLRSNEAFMKKAAESGLKIAGTLEGYEKGFTLIDKGLDSLSNKIDSPIGKKAINLISGGSSYLFETFHPNLKAVTFQDFSNRELSKLAKSKGPLSKAETLKVNRDMGSLVNDIYGGQQWETQKIFNNPKNLKWLRRAIAYPDWTTSALRQAGSVFGKGVRGNAARRYWLKYGVMFATTHGLLKWFNSGWKNNEEGKVVFDVNKANKGITESDPSKWYQFPLPDFNVNIGGTKYNMGRDSDGKKLYGHIGKQMLEIGKWFREPFNSLFGKSNPLIQMAYKQITGGTPFGEKTWTARSKWSEGEQKPWDATNPWTLDRAKSRTKELFSDLMPFSVNTLNQRGIAPLLGSGLGVAAVSRGLNTFTAVPHIKKAIINNDDKLLSRIKTSLRENKIKPSSIQTVITRSRNELKKEGKIKK